MGGRGENIAEFRSAGRRIPEKDISKTSKSREGFLSKLPPWRSKTAPKNAFKMDGIWGYQPRPQVHTKSPFLPVKYQRGVCRSPKSDFCLYLGAVLAYSEIIASKKRFRINFYLPAISRGFLEPFLVAQRSKRPNIDFGRTTVKRTDS